MSAPAPPGLLLSPPPLPYPPPPPPFVLPYRYAGLVDRFLAAVIDLIILVVVGAVLSLPLLLLSTVSLFAFGSLGVFSFLYGPFTLLLFLIWIVYFSYFEGTTGQTVGKRLLHLRVVSISTGQHPDMGRAFLRSILRIVDWLPFFYLVGLFVALLTSRKQRIGDLVAETVVVQM